MADLAWSTRVTSKGYIERTILPTLGHLLLRRLDTATLDRFYSGSRHPGMARVLDLGAAARTLRSADRAKTIDDVRATLLHNIGGLVLLLGANFTYSQPTPPY